MAHPRYIRRSNDVSSKHGFSSVIGTFFNRRETGHARVKLNPAKTAEPRDMSLGGRLAWTPGTMYYMSESLSV